MISYRPAEIKIVGMSEIRIDKHKSILSLILRGIFGDFLCTHGAWVLEDVWQMDF